MSNCATALTHLWYYCKTIFKVTYESGFNRYDNLKRVLTDLRYFMLVLSILQLNSDNVCVFICARATMKPRDDFVMILR